MSNTGFASVDGTDGFTRVGTPFTVHGLFRHRDDFGRLYFEITKGDYDLLIEAHVDDDDNVAPIYFDEYWKVHMIRGKFDKTVDTDPIVAKIDNRLVHVVKGQIYEMAEGSVIEDKPYKGTYLTLESVSPLAKQPKEVQKASIEYLAKKSAKEAAAVREAAKPKSAKKRKVASKKKKPANKKTKPFVVKPKKVALVDDEADEDEGEDEGEEDDQE